ncbi:MAG: HEAT repeat domain-containing protein [Pirellulales bacterium]|nr:HEAT repeat domain-containing protein [Pirellulales bacterium]
MRAVKIGRWLLTGGCLACLVAGALSPAAGAEKNLPPLEEVLKRQPRPARDPLPPSRLPLEVVEGERIALVGNSTAERMNLYGYFESLLHSRFPRRELVVRNFARPADEVAIRQRSNDYTLIDDPVAAFGADTMFCFFGWNESFAGPDGVEKFKADYGRFLDDYAKAYPRDDTGAAPRFVLISPVAFEPPGERLLPDGRAHNEQLKLYADAVGQVAAERGLAFVDLYAPTLARFTAEPGLQYTINGIHQNEAGDREIALLLDHALFGGAPAADLASEQFARLRAAVNDKSWVHLQDYRMLNGWYVYGGRRTWDKETFPREYAKIRNMAAVRDRYVWYIAEGKPVPEVPDDSQTGELYLPTTRFGEPGQNYSEAEELRYLTPDELISSCTVPDGFEIKLFADERRFPELAKPVQMAFDSRGRLWVSTMPTYPQWKPGDPRPADKLVILEDTDRDGTADKSTIFYDKLHCPTGFAFFRGGVLVVDQPRLNWLQDTDGDDRADVVVHGLDGFATDDTHHTIGAFEWNHGNRLHMDEGVAVSTAVETPWGPFRNFGTPGAYVLDPRSQRLSHFVTPGYGNPWCYIFDEWGQGIVGDGTTAVQHWDTPLSGAQFGGREGLKPVFDTQGTRPVVGSEFLVTRHFPDDVQRQFIYGCVINLNGIPRFEIHDDGAGFAGSRVTIDGKPSDLIRSTDKHFRPVDPQLGPDGALWFGDWANALIGHMQYSQRDPNRDHQRGRIYRLVYKARPLLEPVTQADKSIPELLEQFRAYEWRTRNQVRVELQARPEEQVLAAVRGWVAGLDSAADDYDRLRCEALWVQEGFHRVDPELLEAVLSAKRFEARAAAVRIVADLRGEVPGAFDTLARMALDEHPRVRTEALRGLSFYATPEAVDAILAATAKPLDYWTKYTLQHALAANEAVWREAFLKGRLAADNPENQEMLAGLIAKSNKGGAAVPYLRLLLGSERRSEEERNKAMQALADMQGDANHGREVFMRTCTACHKIGDQGREFGPDLPTTAPKRTRVKLIESLIDPNAEVEAKYLSTQIATNDGEVIRGLLVSESPKEVTLFDGKDSRTVAVEDIDVRETLKQSSMPEGLPAGMAPSEFLDVIEYLASFK